MKRCLPVLFVLAAVALLSLLMSCQKEEGSAPSPPGSLTGCVMDAFEWTPLSGVVVTLTDSKGNSLPQKTTGQNGTFSFKSLNPEAYTLKAIPPRGSLMVSWSEEVRIESGKKLELDVFLDPGAVPIVTIEPVAGLTETSATIRAKIAYDGGLPVSEWGIYWGLSGSEHKIAAQGGTEMVEEITGLTPGTTYRCQAYAVNAVGEAFGDVVQFSTQDKIVEIPDPGFRDFLLAEFDRKHGNGDGKIQASELSEISALEVSGNEIKSLEGILYFRKLSFLRCRNTSVSNLNINELALIWSLDCRDNPKLNAIHAEKCSQLVSINCSGCDFRSLDISGYPRLSSLQCSDNPGLSVLKLDGHQTLEYLSCSGCALESLQVKALPSLANINCGFDSNLVALNIEQCPKLQQVGCPLSTLRSLNIKDCNALEYLNCDGNPELESISIGGSPGLSSLSIAKCNFSGHLDLSKYPALTYLFCLGNVRLTSLDVSKCPGLSVILGFDTSIGEVFVSAGQKENIPQQWTFPAGVVYTVR